MNRLLSLSLDRTPAAELLGETARTWADALWPGRAWYDTDAERIAEGFRRMAGAIEQWPAPAVFLRHLPARQPPANVLSLPAKATTDAEREANLARLNAMLREAGIIA